MIESMSRPHWAVNLLIIFTMLVFFVGGWALLLSRADMYFSFTRMLISTLCLLSMGFSIVLMVTLVSDNLESAGTCYFIVMTLVVYIACFSGVIGAETNGVYENRYLNYVATYVQYASILTITGVLWRYLEYVIGKTKGKMRELKKIVEVLYVFGLILICINLVYPVYFSFDGNGNFIAGDYEILAFVSPILITLCGVIAVKKYLGDHRMWLSLACFPLFVAIALIIQNIFGYAELIYPALFLALMTFYGNFYVGRSEDLINKDAELTNQRAEILVSQIQPHFLYNALTSIMNIKGNPPEVRDSIADFGKYLRGNLDTLKLKGPIPLVKELDHVETFMLLKNLSTHGNIDIEFQVADRNFLIPALTLQTIVERCIDKSFNTKNPKGRILISTSESDNAHVIQIEDDGPSFDSVLMLKEDLNEVFGIHMVESRLKEMVGGTVYIESVSEKGMLVTIMIPKTLHEEERRHRFQSLPFLR